MIEIDIFERKTALANIASEAVVQTEQNTNGTKTSGKSINVLTAKLTDNEGKLS